MSLAQKGLSSFIYTFSSEVINKAIIIGGGIYLARLLSPDDYGLVAMIYVVFSISSYLISAGFGLALIREKEITEEDKATVFYFNILVSAIIYIILWLASPLIADFYHKPELITLTRLMGLDLLFGSLTLVQRSVLMREMKFKLLGIISVVSGIFVLVISVLLAYEGYGVYALAIKFIAGSFISSILLFILNPWMPIGFIRKNSFNKLIAFGSNVVVLGIVNNISGNLHQVIIGKYFSTASLGFFNQGNMLKDNLSKTLNQTVMNISFPMLAQLQDDKERLKAGYKRIMRINTFVIYPLITILILTAEPLVLVLLGNKWTGTIVFLQILGIAGYVTHLHNINLNVLKVYGKGKDYIAQGLFRNVITITGVLIAVNFSVIAMAWALVIAEFLQLFVNVYYSNKYLKFSIKEQLEIMFPIIIVTLIMGASVFFIGLIEFPSMIVKLLSQSMIGVLVYFGTAYLLKLEAFIDLSQLIQSKIHRR